MQQDTFARNHMLCLSQTEVSYRPLQRTGQCQRTGPCKAPEIHQYTCSSAVQVECLFLLKVWPYTVTVTAVRSPEEKPCGGACSR